MDYDSLVKKQLNLAFTSRLGNLVDEVVFAQSQSASYNFGTNAVTQGSTNTVTIKGLLSSRRRNLPDSGTNALMLELMFQAADISDVTIYDTVTINGVLYNVVLPYTNNGYTVTVEVTREG